MTERQDGILWRIARLHPGWITLIVWVGWLVFGGYAEATGDNPLAAAAFFAGFMLLYMGYPLFVLLFASGRFRSRSPRRAGMPLGAFFVILIIFSAAILAGADRIESVVEAANAGSIAANLAFGVPFLFAATAFFYLLIGAALALVEAETGRAASFSRKFGTVFAFLYLMFGVFFIHQRIRSLVARDGMPDPIVDDLPMERLTIAPMASGHLCLELTEMPNWESFGRYAEELLRRLDGRVVERITIVDMHLWNIDIETVPLRLVYEDFPNRISLESESYPGDMLLKKLQTRLAPPSGRSKETGPSPSSAGGAARISKGASEG